MRSEGPFHAYRISGRTNVTAIASSDWQDLCGEDLRGDRLARIEAEASPVHDGIMRSAGSTVTGWFSLCISPFVASRRTPSACRRLVVLLPLASGKAVVTGIG